MGIMRDSLKYRYTFMVDNNVPQGYYQSVLMEIRKSEKENGKLEYIDFCYELIDKKGDIYYIRERYKEKNHRWTALISLLTTYGFEPDAEDEELLGLKEQVYVLYQGRYGNLVDRCGMEIVDLTAEDYKISFDM